MVCEFYNNGNNKVIPNKKLVNNKSGKSFIVLTVDKWITIKQHNGGYILINNNRRSV